MLSKSTILDVFAYLAITLMFGCALYIRYLARQKGKWRDFLYSFIGNWCFFKENWRDVKMPLFLMGLAILALIIVTWAKR
jgi:hypothetical protein